jgi:hypothetical protein
MESFSYIISRLSKLSITVIETLSIKKGQAFQEASGITHEITLISANNPIFLRNFGNYA